MRARDVGITFPGTPGPLNAITDIAGIEVAMTTLNFDTRTQAVAARTGVTAILPLGKAGIGTSVPAAIYSLNGNGEMTGSHWINETGALTGPVMITNTHAVGTVHRGVIEWIVRNKPHLATQWLLPVVAETWDGYLNSINEPFITTDHAGQAIDAADSGPVAEGSSGGGTGMNCYGFKGGNGTASREVAFGGSTYTVAVFMQANFGARQELMISGVPMGDLDIPCPIETQPWLDADARAVPGAGSVIVIVATDAPLLPQQCQAMARRIPMGLARTGTTGGHFSGDVFLCFSTANPGALDSGFPSAPVESDQLRQLRMVPWNRMDPFYAATVQAVEESVVNVLVAASDMTGRNGHFSPGLPLDQVRSRLGIA